MKEFILEFAMAASAIVFAVVFTAAILFSFYSMDTEALWCLGISGVAFLIFIVLVTIDTDKYRK